MSKVTVVVDNLASAPEFMAEHGLSLWLEHEGRVILYDTGGGKALMPNLAALGLDPARPEALILSHGHNDHTGGLADLLDLRQAQGLDTPVWCHPDVFAPHFRQTDKDASDAGPPLGGQAAYEEKGAVFHFVSSPVSPWPGVTILASIPRETDFEVLPPGLATQKDGALIPDPLEDDLSLAVEGERGLCVLTGCAHAGVINVLNFAAKVCQKEPVLLIGGTHLGPAPASQQEAAIKELVGRDGLEVSAGHCTGGNMIKRLKAELGPRYLDLGAGTRFTL